MFALPPKSQSWRHNGIMDENHDCKHGKSKIVLWLREEMFVKPGDEVYEGMIVGEHSRPTDIEINPTKEKRLTNMRAAGTDENIKLSPICQMSLEDVVTYIGEDEMIDVSPTKIRMRKRELTANGRKRMRDLQPQMGLLHGACHKTSFEPPVHPTDSFERVRSLFDDAEQIETHILRETSPPVDHLQRYSMGSWGGGRCRQRRVKVSKSSTPALHAHTRSWADSHSMGRL
ncbi:unnamed protein product [Phytophthora lilii]|uniref:Unnamed protein product n=1 Tax=Phytophthora lilii TaxID=2077276 RepID=A0A9W6TGV5_9STRA|nr:unnamed protein product [Phytophthora lilii]